MLWIRRGSSKKKRELWPHAGRSLQVLREVSFSLKNHKKKRDLPKGNRWLALHRISLLPPPSPPHSLSFSLASGAGESQQTWTNSVCVCVCERERERARETDRQRERDPGYPSHVVPFLVFPSFLCANWPTNFGRWDRV